MSELPRRTVLHLVAGTDARAVDYPARPVHIVCGQRAGTEYDVIAQLIAQALSDRLGRQFVVDNPLGASAHIATETVVCAVPDGYTLLMAVWKDAFNAVAWPNMNFIVGRDLVPVAGIGRAPFVATEAPPFPPKTVFEMVAYAKAHPTEVKLADADLPYKRWYGLCAPKGTPDDIVDKLTAAVTACAADAAFTSRLIALGIEPTPMNAAEFGKFIDRETVKWGKMLWSSRA